MDSEPWQPRARREEIDTRLDAVRARLRELGERDPDPDRDPAAISERLEAAQRHAAEAYTAAARVLAASVEAFRNAARAHERVASVHERAAAEGIGDVVAHEQQATLHRAAAAADWRRAERTQSLLSDSEPGRAAADSDEPDDGVTP